MNEQAFVMASDQRKRIQRSRFVCRILNFCVKKPCRYDAIAFYNNGKEIKGTAVFRNGYPVSFSAITAASFVGAV